MQSTMLFSLPFFFLNGSSVLIKLLSHCLQDNDLDVEKHSPRSSLKSKQGTPMLVNRSAKAKHTPRNKIHQSRHPWT